MYRPPLRHVRPHMATGVDIGPRPRASGDIGLIAAASAAVRPSPISMAVASPYFSSSLRMTDLSEGRAPPRHYDPEGKASQPCRPNVSVTRDMSGFRSPRSVRFVPEGSHAAGGQNGPDHRCDWVASSEEAELRGGGGAVGHERAALSPAARRL